MPTSIFFTIYTSYSLQLFHWISLKIPWNKPVAENHISKTTVASLFLELDQMKVQLHLRAVFEKTLLLVLNLTINWYNSTDWVFQQISKYFFLRQSTPAMQPVCSNH